MTNTVLKYQNLIYFDCNKGVNALTTSTTCQRKALLVIAEEIHGELNLAAWIGERVFR
jgi:hypothetical protein